MRQSYPKIANDKTERKIAKYFGDDAERPNNQRNQTISYGQRHEKVIGRVLKVSVFEHGQNNQCVSDYCNQNNF